MSRPFRFAERGHDTMPAVFGDRLHGGGNEAGEGRRAQRGEGVGACVLRYVDPRGRWSSERDFLL